MEGVGWRRGRGGRRPATRQGRVAPHRQARSPAEGRLRIEVRRDVFIGWIQSMVSEMVRFGTVPMGKVVDNGRCFIFEVDVDSFQDCR